LQVKVFNKHKNKKFLFSLPLCTCKLYCTA